MISSLVWVVVVWCSFGRLSEFSRCIGRWWWCVSKVVRWGRCLVMLGGLLLCRWVSNNLVLCW